VHLTGIRGQRRTGYWRAAALPPPGRVTKLLATFLRRYQQWFRQTGRPAPVFNGVLFDQVPRNSGSTCCCQSGPELLKLLARTTRLH
jgi:hypothetical protein